MKAPQSRGRSSLLAQPTRQELFLFDELDLTKKQRAISKELSPCHKKEKTTVMKMIVMAARASFHIKNNSTKVSPHIFRTLPQKGNINRHSRASYMWVNLSDYMLFFESVKFDCGIYVVICSH